MAKGCRSEHDFGIFYYQGETAMIWEDYILSLDKQERKEFDEAWELFKQATMLGLNEELCRVLKSFIHSMTKTGK